MAASLEATLLSFYLIKTQSKKPHSTYCVFLRMKAAASAHSCRVGTEKAVKLMEQDNWDIDLLSELAATMQDASICGLGTSGK